MLTSPKPILRGGLAAEAALQALSLRSGIGLTVQRVGRWACRTDKAPAFHKDAGA